MSDSGRRLAREMFLEALDAVRIESVWPRRLRRDGSTLDVAGDVVDLAAFREIRVCSVGKAAWACLDALQATLGTEFPLSGGVVVSNVPPVRELDGVRAFQASHPYPDAGSLAAAEAALELVASCDEDVLVFFLVSGGGSSLLEAPAVAGATLEDLRELNRVLVGCGANIDEINAVRKHVSAVKGGRLAAASGGARLVSILISDVPDGLPATISSGPTLPDPSTVERCRDVIERYRLAPRLPAAFAAALKSGELAETPKPGDAAFDRSSSVVLLSNADVLDAAAMIAGSRGFATRRRDFDDRDIPETVDHLLEALEELRGEGGGPACILSGGEVRSPVTGDGRGGRNQAFVLHAATRIAGRETVILSGGTDGIDGNSPAAGGVCDGTTVARGRDQGLDAGEAFARSDSFGYLDRLGDAVVTGPQQNNLRDLRMLFVR